MAHGGHFGLLPRRIPVADFRSHHPSHRSRSAARCLVHTRPIANRAPTPGLVLLGVHGAVAEAANRRAREFEIRRALGATDRQIAGLLLRDGAMLTTAGTGIGVLAVVWLEPVARVLGGGTLVGTAAADPWVLGLTVAGVMLVALLTCAATLPRPRSRMF